MELVKVVPVILGVVTAIATLWSAAFLTGKFSPNIKLLLKPIWPESENGLLKLIIEMENQGFIRIGIEKVLLAMSKHELPAKDNKELELIGSEWVSFENGEEIMTSSFYINPKEIIHVERIYSLPKDSAIHAGIQVYLKYPWYIQRLGLQARSTRQTRVYYFHKLFSHEVIT